MNNADKEHSFKIPEENKISIDLCSKTFLISSHFSMNDMEIFFDSLDHGNSAKFALADIVYHKLQRCALPIPTKDELYLEDDDAFEPFIEAVINEDDDLKSIYTRTDLSLLITERFAISYRQYWNECTKELSKAIQSTIKDMVQLNTNNDFSWVNSFQQTVKQYQSIINNALVQATQIAQRMVEFFVPIQNTIVQLSSNISDIIAKIQIPTYTDNEKQRLENSYKDWGKLGWSIIPHAPFHIFSKSPPNAKEADKIALKYFNNKGMKYLFSKMQEKRIKKEDLESAIFCYENKQYKACALILFGIIDAKLIQLQPKQTNNNYRKTGQSAVLKLKKNT